MLYRAIKASSTRKERMQELAEKMRKTHQKMEELNYQAYVLSKQGKREESFRKTKAAKIAKEYWCKLDRDYKKLWKNARLKNS